MDNGIVEPLKRYRVDITRRTRPQTKTYEVEDINGMEAYQKAIAKSKEEFGEEYEFYAECCEEMDPV